MSNNDRPLSPHISIYRWPITMTTSILHRATGLALSVGFIVFALWLFDAASGAEAYGSFTSYMGGRIGTLLLVGWSFAFFFHSGRGFEKSQANASSWFVLILAVVLTALFWWVRL